MYVIIAGLMLALVAVLVSGVVLMGIGGELNKKYSHRLMVARVWLQALVLLAVAALLLMGGGR